MGYRNIQFRVGDGGAGWPEDAPFDAVIVTAAPPVLPAALVSQVRPGGRLIAPVGEVGADDQRLVLVEKTADGAIAEHDLGGVRFVPLVSESVSDR